MKSGKAGGSFTVAVCALSLMGCSGERLLPRDKANAATFQTYEQVEAAYATVIAGTTTTADLSKIGFDLKITPNVEVLSYVGVVERLPEKSRSPDRFPPQVQACIRAQDRCVAYLFRSERVESRHVGNAFLDLAGFERDTIHSGWSAEVVLLVQDERVVYKLMTGHPRIEETQTSTQPLGPLQNLGSTATGTPPEKNE
jgi:hypothetical protein